MADRPIVHIGEQPSKPYLCPVDHETGERLPQEAMPSDVGPDDVRFCSQHAADSPIWVLGLEFAITNTDDMSASDFIEGLKNLIAQSDNVIVATVSEEVQAQ